MKIVRITSKDVGLFQQMAVLLVEGFQDTGTTAWPDLEAGLKEVEEDLQDDHINFVAIDDNNMIQGWIGGIKKYDGNSWELHPIVVKPEFQGRGIGRALVSVLEKAIKDLGGMNIFLGADDENFRTTVSGIDLYPNVLEKLQRIENPGSHPYEFYQKVGFSIVGILPDANGLGKPDIMMAKRVD